MKAARLLWSAAAVKPKFFGPLLQVLFFCALAIWEIGCGGSSGPPPIPVTVSVSPPSTELQGVGGQSFTATVNNDPKNAGVAWTVSCSSPPCGSVSPAQTPSGQPTTYTSPPTALANNMNVTVTATSVASSSASAHGMVTLDAVQLNIIADNYAVEPGAQSHLTVTIWNGVNPINVNWSCSPSPCGTFSSTTTQSGVATTYTAPATVPAAGMTANITATWADQPSITSVQAIQVYGVQVSVTPPSANLIANGSQPFTATVANDATNSGVNWTVSCDPAPPCGTVSNASTQSGVPTTYSAPATPPPSDLTVTVTATSVAYAPATATASVTVPAVTVSALPGSGLIPLNANQTFTATVGNDPNKAGVNWTLMQGTPPANCAPACGSVSPSTTLNGNPTTYTAPAAIPGSPPNPAVTLTATSVTDITKSSTPEITLSSGTVQLVPYSLNFGFEVEHGISRPRSVTLTNTGASTLSITDVSVTGADAGDFSITGNTCGSSVAAAASCTISLVFKPSTSGRRTANLSITDSSTDSPQLVSLLGTGLTIRDGEGKRMSSALANAGTVAVPLPTGPEPVGTRVFDLMDTSRQDPFLGGGARRELLVRMWYPAALTEACSRADYTSPRVWSYFSQLVGVPLPQVMTNSCLNAPVAGGLHPLVVLTHGYTGTFTDYTFIAEDLASRGYVVASVDHTYEATAVEFPDGRFVKSALGSHLANTWRGDEATLSFAVSVRLQDLRFVLDELERMNSRVDDPFGGKLDVSRLAIAGHSAGGTIAFQALESDARFKAAVILDGYLPTAFVHPTNAPVLIVSAGREVSPDHCTLWSNLHGQRLFVNLDGAEHLTPSDALWLAKGAIATGPMGPDRTVAAIRDYVAAFLDTNLRDRPVHPLLTGPSSIYPDARVTTGEEPACSQRVLKSAGKH